MHVSFESDQIKDKISTYRVVPPYLEKWGVNQQICAGLSLCKILEEAQNTKISMDELFQEVAEHRVGLVYSFTGYPHAGEEFWSYTLNHLLLRIEELFQARENSVIIRVYDAESSDRKLLGEIQIDK